MALKLLIKACSSIWLIKLANEKIQYITGIKKIAARIMVISTALKVWLFNLKVKKDSIEFVAIDNIKATKIAFKKGWKSSTRKNKTPKVIAIRKYCGFKIAILHLFFHYLGRQA